MSDDFISKRNAVSAISDLLMLKLRGERLPTFNEVYRAIQAVPSEPERKTGKWEHPNRCSECGFGVLLSPYMHNLDTGEYTLLYKFCPNCGAKMEGEDDG